MSLLPKCRKCGILESSAGVGGVCESCREASVATLTDHDRTVVDGRANDNAGVAANAFVRLPDYELLSEIARGGMGIVFKARQVSLNRMVAVKVIRSGQFASAAEVQRFLIEARAAATLQHPNIVAIHEIGEQEGQNFFSMDFVEGQSLGDLVQHHALPANECAEVVRKVATAIHYAHQRGILHRDLKPSNILIDQQKQPRITDFGLAKLMSDRSDLTLSGMVMGSPSYMPPEQAEGRTNEITIRSDIYSLGAILYQLLTGKPPFVGESPLATMKLVIERDPIAPRQLIPRIPKDLETICLKCLEKNPLSRYGSAEELSEELERFLRDEPIRARSHGTFERTWRWCRRKPAVAAALGIFVCGFVGVFWQWRRAEKLAVNEAELRHRAEKASVDALLAQARILRSSGTVGQRHRSLAALQAAAKLLPSPEIRDEIIACLPLADLRVGRDWDAALEAKSVVAVSGDLTTLGRADGRGLFVATVPEAPTRLDGNGSNVTALVLSRDGAVLGVGYEGAAAAWDVAGRKALLQATNFSGPVVVDVTTDGKRLVAGDGAGAIQVYELASSRFTCAFATGRSSAAVRFDPSGGHVAVCSAESLNVIVFDGATGEEVGRLAHPAAVNDLAWDPAGATLAAACADNQIYLWDSRHSARRVLRGHTAPPQKIVFANSGSAVATLGQDKSLRLWEASTGRLLVRWEGISSPLLRFGTGDRSLACSAPNSAPSHLQQLQVTWPEAVKVLPENASGALPNGVGIVSQQNDLLAVPGEDGLHVWDIASAARVGVVPMGRVESVARSRDGGTWFTRGFYGVHQLAARQEKVVEPVLILGPASFMDAPPGTSSMAVDGADNLIVAESGQITVLGAATGNVLKTFRAPAHLSSLAASNDQNWIAAGDWEEQRVLLWDRKSTTSQIVTNLTLHGRPVIAFSPNSQWLAAGTETDCYLWRTATWKLERRLHKERAGLKPAALAFSPDSSVLAWASSETVASLTEVESGRTLLQLPAGGVINGLQFTPQGGALLVCADGSPMTIWDLGLINLTLSDYGFRPSRSFPPYFSQLKACPRKLLVNVQKVEETQKGRQDLHKAEAALENDPESSEAWRQIGIINSYFFRFTACVPAYLKALSLRSNDVSALAELAYVQLKLEHPAEAMEAYEKMAQLEPQNAFAFQQLAYMCLHVANTGQNVEAGMRYARRALELQPADPACLFWMGVAEYRSARYEQALSFIEKALQKNPTSLTYPFYRAMCLAMLQRTNDSKEVLSAALNRLESNPNTWVEHRAHFQSFIREAQSVCPTL